MRPPRGLRSSTQALRMSVGNPELIRLQLAWSAVATGGWITTVSLLALAYTEGGSRAVAVAVLAGRVPSALLGTPGGALSDRFAKRRVLLGSALCCAAGAGGAAAAGSRLSAVIVLIAVVSVATVPFRAAQSAALPELVADPRALTAANVLSGAVEALGVFVGPALAAVLLSAYGTSWTFAAAGVLFAAACVLLRGLPSGTSGYSFGPRLDGRRGVLQLPLVRLVLLLVLAQAVASGALVVLYPALAVEGLGLGVGAVGLLSAAYGLGGVVGSLGLFSLAGSTRLGRATAAALVLYGLPLLLLLLLPRLAPALALLVLVGVANVVFDVTAVTLLQRGVPRRLLGRAFGCLETAVGLGLALGALLALLLDSSVGPAAALALLGAVVVLVGLVSAAGLARVDRDLAAPRRQVQLLRSLPAFALLSTPALERLALALRRHDLPVGAVAVRQGDRGDDYLIVDSGTLDVEVDGRRVAELGPGEGFGEIALLHDGMRTATVSARTPVCLWSLGGAEFLDGLGTKLGRTAVAAEAAARLRRAAPRHPSP